MGRAGSIFLPIRFRPLYSLKPCLFCSHILGCCCKVLRPISPRKILNSKIWPFLQKIHILISCKIVGRAYALVVFCRRLNKLSGQVDFKILFVPKWPWTMRPAMREQKCSLGGPLKFFDKYFMHIFLDVRTSGICQRLLSATTTSSPCFLCISCTMR